MDFNTVLNTEVSPCWQGLRDCILRRGTPDRVYHIELFLDFEVKNAICERFGVDRDLDRNDPQFPLRQEMMVQRFLGYDYVRCGIQYLPMPMKSQIAEDTAELGRENGRSYIDEYRGPITSWEEFERYPWPDPEKCSTRDIEWYAENLPEGMCIIGSSGFAHFAIESCVDFKGKYGDHIATLGGIDLDFLCRSDETAIRERVRQTLDACFEGGGYCLGTGNSVANYIPLEHYLVMLDEGRRYTR